MDTGEGQRNPIQQMGRRRARKAAKPLERNARLRSRQLDPRRHLRRQQHCVRRVRRILHRHVELLVSRFHSAQHSLPTLTRYQGPLHHACACVLYSREHRVRVYAGLDCDLLLPVCCAV